MFLDLEIEEKPRVFISSEEFNAMSIREQTSYMKKIIQNDYIKPSLQKEGCMVFKKDGEDIYSIFINNPYVYAYKNLNIQFKLGTFSSLDLWELLSGNMDFIELSLKVEFVKFDWEYIS